MTWWGYRTAVRLVMSLNQLLLDTLSPLLSYLFHLLHLLKKKKQCNADWFVSGWQRLCPEEMTRQEQSANCPVYTGCHRVHRLSQSAPCVCWKAVGCVCTLEAESPSQELQKKCTSFYSLRFELVPQYHLKDMLKLNQCDLHCWLESRPCNLPYYYPSALLLHALIQLKALSLS